MDGVFIVFEGGDGAGKTTQSGLLVEWLIRRGKRVTQTREPGGTPLGTALRELLLHTDGQIDPRAEALLYAADRAQHVAEVVRPALERGDFVVQDRYIDSSLAYQGAGRVLNTEDVQCISEWASENLKPDLTILLDVAPGTAVARRSSSEKVADRLERESDAFHSDVRQGFLRLAHGRPDAYLVIDATEPPERIHAEVIARVREILP